MDIALRVAARKLYGDAIVDPKSSFELFRHEITKFCIYEEQAEKDLRVLGEILDAFKAGKTEVIPDLQRRLDATAQGRKQALYDIKYGYWFQKGKQAAWPLFLAILQQYVLPPQLRKSIENASRFWSKTRMKARSKSPYGSYDELADNLRTYVKVCQELRKQVSSAMAAIVKGKLHSDPEVAAVTRFPAGPFTAINTGGFDDKVMAAAVDVCKKAATAFSGSGLSKVCYGDVLISKTVNNKRTVAAFYIPGNDEMFIRANTPDNWDTIQIVCHELAHRLHYKFLKSKDFEIRRLYSQMSAERFTARETGQYPSPGETTRYKGKTIVVREVSPWKGTIKLKEEAPKPGEENVVYTVSIDGWYQLKGLSPADIPDFKGFVTKYARTNPDENFAEMVSFYVLGKLPKTQVPLLEEILS